MKTYLKLILTALTVVIFNGCTLDVQDQFDYKSDTFINYDPFDQMTAWEYIQTRTSNSIRDSQGRIRFLNSNVIGSNGDELDFLIAAIKRVGYEELYNQKATTDRTYILLNNNAFMGNANNPARVINTIRAATPAGSTPPPAVGTNGLVNPDTYFDNFTPEQLNVLKAILRYHIVTTYVAQIPTIPTFGVNVLFKTSLPQVNLDGNGLPVSLSQEMADIAFYRNIDTRTTLLVNNVGSPLPATANTLGYNETVRRHNYVFANGIGHYLNELVRYQPYELYANLPLD